MKNKFPIDHFIKEDTKEVWVTGIGAITAMGISQLVQKYYPGYSAKIATKEYYDQLKNNK